MIMITPKAGQRFAKAKAALDRWKERGGNGQTTPVMLRAEYAEAAAALADELIESNHHLVEGD